MFDIASLHRIFAKPVGQVRGFAKIGKAVGFPMVQSADHTPFANDGNIIKKIIRDLYSVEARRTGGEVSIEKTLCHKLIFT